MNPSIAYDIKAEAFRSMTGRHAPGKDIAAAAYEGDAISAYDVRSACFDVWCAAHKEVLHAVLRAVEQVLPEACE